MQTAAIDKIRVRINLSNAVICDEGALLHDLSAHASAVHIHYSHAPIYCLAVILIICLSDRARYHKRIMGLTLE